MDIRCNWIGSRYVTSIPLIRRTDNIDHPPDLHARGLPGKLIN
jgi:hypothetical protein